MACTPQTGACISSWHTGMPGVPSVTGSAGDSCTPSSSSEKSVAAGGASGGAYASSHNTTCVGEKSGASPPPTSAISDVSPRGTACASPHGGAKPRSATRPTPLDRDREGWHVHDRESLVGRAPRDHPCVLVITDVRKARAGKRRARRARRECMPRQLHGWPCALRGVSRAFLSSGGPSRFVSLSSCRFRCCL